MEQKVQNNLAKTVAQAIEFIINFPKYQNANIANFVLSMTLEMMKDIPSNDNFSGHISRYVNIYILLKVPNEYT